MRFTASLVMAGMVYNVHGASSLRRIEQASEPGSIPVQFDSFCTSDFCAFRVMATLGGLDLLVDSGSSSLGFCLDYDQNLVTGVQPAETASGEQVSQCALYGGGVVAHGWTGPSYIGNVTGPNDGVLTNVLFSTMKYKVGENGNACGEPAKNSAGVSQPMGGIWGIAGEQLNYVVLMTDAAYETWAGVGENSQCYTEQGQCQCPEPIDYAADSLLTTIAQHVGSNDADQWGLSWDGSLGQGAGKMYFGEYANLPGESEPIPMTMQDGFYNFEVNSVLVNDEAVEVAPFTTLFDTGTPSLQLPSAAYEAAKSALTSEGVSVTLVLKSKTGASVPVKMTFPPTIAEQDVEVSERPIIGLPLMRYVEYIKMNVAEGTMQLIPRNESDFILTPNLNIFSKTDSPSTGSFHKLSLCTIVSTTLLFLLPSW